MSVLWLCVLLGLIMTLYCVRQFLEEVKGHSTCACDPSLEMTQGMIRELQYCGNRQIWKGRGKLWVSDGMKWNFL